MRSVAAAKECGREEMAVRMRRQSCGTLKVFITMVELILASPLTQTGDQQELSLPQVRIGHQAWKYREKQKFFPVRSE